MEIKEYKAATFIGDSTELFEKDKKYGGKYFVTKYGVLFWSSKYGKCFQSGLANWRFEDKYLRMC